MKKKKLKRKNNATLTSQEILCYGSWTPIYKCDLHKVKSSCYYFGNKERLGKDSWYYYVQPERIHEDFYDCTCTPFNVNKGVAVHRSVYDDELERYFDDVIAFVLFE